MAISSGPVSIAERLLPILGWLPSYRRAWLLPDTLAGVAVWAVMVPEGMAYSGIVGVPPIMGLYTIIPLSPWTSIRRLSYSGCLRRVTLGPGECFILPGDARCGVWLRYLILL
jgi:hypothetical protein